MRDLKSKATSWGRGLEHAVELAEVEGSGLAFRAKQYGRIGDSIQTRQKFRHVAGGRFVAAAAGFRAVGFVQGTGAQATHEQGALVADLGLHDGLGERQSTFWIGEHAELIGPQRDVFRRGRLQGGDESAVARHVDDGDFEHGQAFQGLRGELDVAEDDDLTNGGDGNTLDFFAMLANDQVLAAFADVGSGFLEVQHGPVIALGKNAGDAVAAIFAWGWIGPYRGLAQKKQRFFGLTDGGERTTETAVTQVGRQGLRRGYRGGKAHGWSGSLAAFWCEDRRRDGTSILVLLPM